MRRRAGYLSSMAMLTGCGAAPEPAPAAPIVSVDADEASPVEPLASAAKPPPPPTSMPPLDVPPEITDEGREFFEWLADDVRDAHGLLDGIEDTVPDDCPITTEDCVPLWVPLARQLAAARRHELPPPEEYAGNDADAVLYRQRLAAHRTFLDKRRQRLERRLRRTLQRWGKPAEARWQELLQRAAEPRPRICLSPAW